MFIIKANIFSDTDLYVRKGKYRSWTADLGTAKKFSSLKSATAWVKHNDYGIKDCLVVKFEEEKERIQKAQDEDIEIICQAFSIVEKRIESGRKKLDFTQRRRAATF